MTIPVGSCLGQFSNFPMNIRVCWTLVPRVPGECSFNLSSVSDISTSVKFPPFSDISTASKFLNSSSFFNFHHEILNFVSQYECDSYTYQYQNKDHDGSEQTKNCRRVQLRETKFRAEFQNKDDKFFRLQGQTIQQYRQIERPALKVLFYLYEGF